MTDDLVKRLNEDFSANAREDIQHQMKVYEKERKEAADRIEELEAALRQIAETPDHYTLHMVRTHARVALGEKKDG